MASLAQACASGELPADIIAVICHTEGSPALQRASELGLPTFVVVPGEDYGFRLCSLLGSLAVRLVCLAGYMRLLPSEVLQAYPRAVLNIHPALLPRFGGKGMYGSKVHEAVLAAGETETGCTVHYVTEVYDEGETLLQIRCPVIPGDTASAVAERVLVCEHQAYPQAVKLWLEQNRS